MMLTLLPLPYKILAVALLAAALLAFGFLKGAQWEQGKHAVDVVEAYKDMHVRMITKAKEERERATKFALERDKEKSKNRILDQDLKTLLNRPKYKAPECAIDDDVAEKINGMLK